jgi:hypothetical protein
MNPVDFISFPPRMKLPFFMVFLSLAVSIPLSGRALALSMSHLRSGDVILISLPCRICKVIEAEEEAPFSHMGIILQHKGRITVLDAYHEVREIPLQDFLKLRDPAGGSPVILRAKLGSGHEIANRDALMLLRFNLKFRGLSYDSEFLWDNADGKGEKLYCSEFAAKFLNAYLQSPLEPKPMHFRVSREDWIRFFKGPPPDGRPGISPADFYRSALFRNLGTLDP